MIQIQAMLSEFRSLADRTLKFSVHTQELPSKTKAELFELEHQFGYLVFKPSLIAEEELKDLPETIDPDFKSIKSASQRLQAVIAVYLKKWGEQNNKTITSTQIRHTYEKVMEEKIEEYKRKIDELSPSENRRA
jgi:hypothetical protein